MRVRSYLTPILVIAHGTGRRISSILKLRPEDLLPDHGPFGALRWRADADKMGVESVVPISSEVRAAIDRQLAERHDQESPWLFPSPRDPAKPVRRELARKWLREAERMAGLEKLKGGLWHPYRRQWATARKHLPDVDVAAAGGWKTIRTLVDIYQQPDDDSMLRVVLEGGTVRSVGGAD